MRFSTAWARLAQEKNRLTVLNYVLGIGCLALCVATVTLGMRKPLLIERECLSRVIDYGVVEATESEVEAFLVEALNSRYNTHGVMLNSDLLSLEQIQQRTQDFEELSKRNIHQRVILNNVRKVKIDGYLVADTDRILSVGELRSAFHYPLKIKIAKTARTKNNPYGLVVTKSFNFEEKDTKKDGNGV